MAYKRGFGQNGKSFYTNVTQPMSVWCNFVVDSTNGNGWGVRSVKSNGYVEAVFMNTSAAPAKQNGLLNPNPQAGYAVVTFKNTFQYYLGGFAGQIFPLTSTSTTSLIKGDVYVITSLGTTTLAQWLAAGLQLGVTPTATPNSPLPAVQTPSVGMSFVAAATASLGGTGTVGIPGSPTTQVISIVGDPNQTVANVNIAANAGAMVMVQFAASTSSSVTTLIPAAPPNGTVVGMNFNFDGSSVTIDGI